MPGHDSFSELKVKVLLVDDQPANLLALEAVLEDLRQHLVRAYSGEEALRLLQEDDFAVVLLDVQMPGLGGFPTARLIRSQPRSRHTPIIFLTAYESDAFPVVEAYRLGAVDYLVKPLAGEIVRAKTAGFVELFQKTEQIRIQAEQLREMERRDFERKLAEEDARLRQSEERFARFMRHLPGLAWIKDARGRYLFANDAAMRAFQTSRESLYGKSDEEIFPAETAAQFRENDRQALASEAGLQVIETLEHDDGVVHHSLVSKFPIPGPTGEETLVGGVAFDVTDMKRAEAALREADRRKDEFLAMLAHELRNPLAPIRNAVEVIAALSPADDDLRRARDMIERQVRHMTRLVDDLLDVSRVTRGKITLRKEPAPVEDILVRAAEAIRPLMEARRHQLIVSLPAKPLHVEADATRLAQVLDNLLANAAKYQDDGGRVWLSACREGGEAVLRVRDQGVGIPREKLAEVFDLFTQVDSSLDRSQGGLGIGLALVRSLVRLHGGSVSAASSGRGQGSEFTVRLPLCQKAEEGRSPQQTGKEASSDSSCPRSPSSFRKVLVVDDNVDAAESLALLLRLTGHQVRTVHAAAAVLEAARDFQPQVIFLDIGLPGGVNGYDLAPRIREQPGLGSVVLVALTGYGQEEDRRRARAAGFDHHLTKPADLQAVQALLADAPPAAQR